MPTLAQVIAKINSDITTNGNEEITGLVLNSVLLDIVAQINDLTGKLEDLNTDDVTSIVNAINSLKQELDNFINSQTGALSGFNDPNETAPIGFDGRVGTIYLKMSTIGAETIPESYWIYTSVSDVGWLNLTADDTFKMVVVDHYTDLPAQGQTNRIYFVQDESNTYIWNVNIFPNDYILVGGVVEGEYIDDTTFNDEFGNPVTPNTGNLYLDTITGKYYRWDGNYFLPIDQDTGGGGADYSNLTNNVLPKKDPSGNALVDSNIQDTAVGSEVSGRLDSNATVERRIEINASSSFTIDLDDPSGHYDLTLTDNTSISFSNMIGTNQSTVITLVVGGNYSLLFPSWLKPMPNNDDYYSNSASDVNLITILIRNGGGSPQGMYSLSNIDIS